MLGQELGSNTGAFTTKLDRESTTQFYILPVALTVMFMFHITIVQIGVQYAGVSVQQESICNSETCQPYNNLVHSYGDIATFCQVILVLSMIAICKISHPLRAYNSLVTVVAFRVMNFYSPNDSTIKQTMARLAREARAS